MADLAELPKSSSNGGLLLLAENALEKLKIADYDREYCYKKDQLPFSRTYFTEPAANTSNQWTAFLGLVGWIMKELRHEFAVDKYDDPNTSSNKLMLALKQLNFAPDFPVSRLKQGYGEAVCQVLDFLASRLLKQRGFRFEEPQYPTTDGFEEAQVDEEADLGTADVVDEAVESEEEDGLYSEHVRAAKALGGDAADATRPEDMDAEGKDNGIIHGEQSADFMAKWRAELERVAPRLKARLQTSTNEWRAHLEQVKSHESTIQKALPACSKQLTQINKDLSEALERINSKETFLGNTFSHIAQEYKQVREQLKQVTGTYETSNEAVEKLSNELGAITEALDELKGDMDSRGNSMVDTSPLQRIRKALGKLKAEIKQMELRIGVVGHSLLQAGLASAQEARNRKASVDRSGSEAKSPLGSEDLNHSPRSPGRFEAF